MASEESRTPAETVPLNGALPVSGGLPAVIRIPVPGTAGLAVELKPRGYVPQSGSTSTIFVQDMTGKRHLRLDYGYNKVTSNIEWHWNQKGTHSDLGIKGHQVAGKGAAAAGRAARYFRAAGRLFVVAGAAIDTYTIVTASNPLRRTAQVVGAWGMAWGGCKIVGAAGGAGGVALAGWGAIPGALAGCAVGGFLGYWAGETVTGYAYDWAEGTIFTAATEVPAP